MKNINLFVSTCALSLVVLPALAGTLTCTSNGSAEHCDLSNATSRDIRINQTRAGNCDYNSTWGVDNSGIWVDQGCSAVFEYSQAASTDNYENDDYPGVVVGPGVGEVYYGPGFYYGGGYYNNNGWNDHNNNYDDNHDYNHGDEGYHGGGGGGYHGGGGRR